MKSTVSTNKNFDLRTFSMAFVGLFATLFILGFAFDVFNLDPEVPTEDLDDLTLDHEDPVITPIDPVVAPVDPVVAPIDLDNIVGTEGDDTLSSTDDRTTITGLAGNDVIFGNNANLEIYGGPGNDNITTLGGSGVVSGGEGEDRMEGGEDNDVFSGESGDDFLAALGGDDALYGGRGQDTLIGGRGDDLLHGGYRPDNLGTIANITFIELVEDDLESDFLSGGDGNDTIYLGANDLAFGHRGSDNFHVMNNGSSPASEISDFDPNEDILTLELDRDPNDVQAINDPVVTLMDNGPDVEIFADGSLLTVVRGVAGQMTLNDVVVNRGLTASI